VAYLPQAIARVATVAARGPSSLTRRLAWLVCAVFIHGVREVAVTGCDVTACCPVVALLCRRQDGGDLSFPTGQRVLVFIGEGVPLGTQFVPLIRERLTLIRCGITATPSFICRSLLSHGTPSATTVPVQCHRRPLACREVLPSRPPE
jgi:hypothetical protein